MSDRERYPRTPLRDLDRSAVATYPLASRPGKVGVGDLGRPLPDVPSLAAFVDSLPRTLSADSLRQAAEALAAARRQGRGVLLGMGAHPIKAGLGPLLADAIERGILTGVATNGAAVVHDLELALCGRTSEDVGAVLEAGRFGMAEETAVAINGAVVEAAAGGEGIGRAVGRLIATSGMPHADVSVFAAAFRASVPATVHVAIGTDIVHMHPSCDGAATGAASLSDFHLFARQVAALGGGCYLNLGSAVIMPEVFLKAYSLARNLGHAVEGLTTVNMDQVQHYRPRVNVLERPTRSSGRGLALTGPHEVLLPLLLGMVRERLA